MAQEFHNWLTIAGPYRDRIDFIASALGHCPWHWYKVEFDAEAPLGGDAGASSLDFYSRGAPAGLDELMRRHPNIAIMAIHFNLSAPAIYREVTKANQIYYHHEGDVDYYLKEADREAIRACWSASSGRSAPGQVDLSWRIGTTRRTSKPQVSHESPTSPAEDHHLDGLTFVLERESPIDATS